MTWNWEQSLSHRTGRQDRGLRPHCACGAAGLCAVIGFAPINTFKCADQHIHGKQDVNALLLAPLSTPHFAETQVRVGFAFPYPQ